MSIHKTEVETSAVEVDQLPVQTGWRAKYNSALVQMVLVSFVCFCCPGMFNALGGLGGGGKQDATTADNGNVALYSTFAFFGFFGVTPPFLQGTICNKLGPRLTLSIGSVGYSLYIGALYSTVVAETKPRENFVIAAGAILGLCAGMLWTAEGAFMLSYATEKTKGRYTALFWMIFNLGAVIGAAIPMGQNWNSGKATAASGSTYIAFLVITLIGACIPFFLAKPANVIRGDGSRVTVERQPTWKTELKGLFFVLKSDPWVVLLFPFFMSSNWFTSYQSNDVNGSGYFGIRGRTLNNFLSWLAQIVGAFLMGLFLDSNLSRRSRAYGGWAICMTLTCVIFGGNFAAQRAYTRETVAPGSGFVSITVGDSGYAGRAILYMLNGLYDAAFQTFAYWSIGCFSNDIRKLAIIVGFYKGMQSAGAAITFRMDSLKVPYMAMLGSSWGVLAGGLIIMAPVLFIRVQDHTVEDTVDEAGDVVAERELKDGEHVVDQKV